MKGNRESNEGGEKRGREVSVPCVMVPVLSRATALRPASRSKTSPPPRSSKPLLYMEQHTHVAALTPSKVVYPSNRHADYCLRQSIEG
jgi:hypothetical protein